MIIIPEKLKLKFTYAELKALRVAILEEYHQVVDIKKMERCARYEYYAVRKFYQKTLMPKLAAGRPANHKKELGVTLEIPQLYALHGLMAHADLYDERYSLIDKLDRAVVSLVGVVDVENI
jgi:hypothetical protein